MNFVIKVADFGLAVNLGPKHYFRQDKTTVVKLPLRWLAPESIHEFLFSEKSDVVSTSFSKSTSNFIVSTASGQATNLINDCMAIFPATVESG